MEIRFGPHRHEPRRLHRSAGRRHRLARALRKRGPWLRGVLCRRRRAGDRPHPRPITSPLAIEAADSSFTGIEFVPDSFVAGPLRPGAALYALEGDFGFSAANATSPAPEVGHEIKLINFSAPGQPFALKTMRFAHNTTFEQAFVDGLRGFNRPTNVRMGPDGCAWVVDYGAVRDFGQSDPAAKYVGANNGPLVQIPGTGVIWRICRK